jgi:excisionase family DNA binding protein
MSTNLTLYTIDEVAQILKVSKRTVYNYIKSGFLKAIKVGKYWRVMHTDLETFLVGIPIRK